jgi:uncharacterized protein (DUF2252 family)
MRDVVHEVRAFNFGREVERVTLKYAKMAESPFGFFRGTCHLFWRDWPLDTALDDAPRVWICGDLHLENFGSFKGDDGRAYFDVNDFDEAALAPASWDLARLLCSLHLAGLGKTGALAESFLDAYCAVVADGEPIALTLKTATPPVAKLLEKTAQRTQKALLDGRTKLAGGRRSLRLDDARRDADPRQLEATALDRDSVAHFLAEFARRVKRPRELALIDVARRIAGTGSLGLGRFVVLARGKGGANGNLLLDLKQAAPSAPGRHAPSQPDFPDEAERVIRVRRWVQLHPPARVDAVWLRQKPWLLRELQPTEDRLDLKKATKTPGALPDIIADMARALASMHLRGCGRRGADSTKALRQWAATRWRKPLLRYAESYAGKVEADWKAWRARDPREDPDRPVAA